MLFAERGDIETVIHRCNSLGVITTLPFTSDSLPVSWALAEVRLIVSNTEIALRRDERLFPVLRVTP